MELQDKVKLLRSFPLFKVLPEIELKAIAYVSREKKFPPKMILIKQEETTDAVYFILSGSVRVYRLTEDGEEITISVLGSGDVVGEMALVDHEPRSAFVQTLKETHVFSISGSDFLKILREYPETAILMLSALARRVRKTDEHIEDVLSKNLTERTWKTLKVLARYFSNSNITLSHEELSSIIGATRARVTEILDTLQREEKIVLSHRNIQVL